MIPEFGHFALIIAFVLATCQAIIPFIGAYRNNSEMMAVGPRAATGQLVFVAISFICLIWSFVQSDFSVLYVAQHSQLALPLGYKISAVWSAHEGSLLMWLLILATWTTLVAHFSEQIPEKLLARTLGVLGLLSIGFLLFALLTSNPFERLIPAALDGADLNPLLQDPGLAIHPPILYVGYVGFSVSFAIAIAVMIGGESDRQWAQWMRPWTLTAWMFLTIGIALGSWWAYYELGWGGWWFWDAVENASFMPWLVGTALIHSLAATSRRGLFTSWTLLLAVSAFSLSLLGTFLVRSGIIVSVHAFATDPTRGIFILSFLAIVVLGALALYAWRAPSLDTSAGFSLLSRETFLLLNNVLLVVATIIVMLGTLAPLFIEMLNGEKVSIGPPWFELAFLVPMIPLILLLGIGMHTAWRRQESSRVVQVLKIPAIVAIIFGVLLPLFFYGRTGLMLAVGTTSGVWILLSSLIQPVQSMRRKSGVPSITRPALGMSIAHFGMGLFVLGVTLVSTFGVESDRALSIGKSIDVAGFDFRLLDVSDVEGPNYAAVQAVVEISKDGNILTTVRPQKRQYRVQKSWMTEAGIHPMWNKDLFVALGDQLSPTTWSMRIQYKPMIRFIWIGAFIMALGGLVALGGKSKRSQNGTSEQLV